MAHRSPTVMVVDDDVDFRRALSDALGDEGWRIVEAKDGQDALEQLGHERPNLLLVDLLMPNMSGLELLQRMRKTPALRGIKVVVITAANDAMLSIKLDVPVVYKGDLDNVLRIVRDSLGAPAPTATTA